MPVLRKRKPVLLPQHKGNLPTPSTRPSRRKKGRGRRRVNWVAVLVCLGVVVGLILLLLGGEDDDSSSSAAKPQHPVFLHKARNFTKHHVSHLLDKVRRPHKNKKDAKREKPMLVPFTCPGSDKKDATTTAFLNDNYCDCTPDGADEPGTAACAHVTVGVATFACRSDPTMRIFASRVGDGVRDCPDASDEEA